MGKVENERERERRKKKETESNAGLRENTLGSRE